MAEWVETRRPFHFHIKGGHRWAHGSWPRIHDIKNKVPKVWSSWWTSENFFPTESLWSHFGIVYGLAGCKKIRMIKSCVQNSQEGFFYYQEDTIRDFTEGLADAVELKATPRGVLVYALSPTYISYYHLQDNSWYAVWHCRKVRTWRLTCSFCWWMRHSCYTPHICNGKISYNLLRCSLMTTFWQLSL